MSDNFGDRPIGEAFNDPRVPCCGRDAADCDCIEQNMPDPRCTFCDVRGFPCPQHSSKKDSNDVSH